MEGGREGRERGSARRRLVERPGPVYSETPRSSPRLTAGWVLSFCTSDLLAAWLTLSDAIPRWAEQAIAHTLCVPRFRATSERRQNTVY